MLPWVLGVPKLGGEGSGAGTRGLRMPACQLGKTAPGSGRGREASRKPGSNPPLTGLRGSLSGHCPHSPGQSEGFNEVMRAMWLVHCYSCSTKVCRMDGYMDVRSPAPAGSGPPMRTVAVEVTVSMGREGVWGGDGDRGAPRHQLCPSHSNQGRGCSRFPSCQNHLHFKNSSMWLRVPEQPELSAHQGLSALGGKEGQRWGAVGSQWGGTQCPGNCRDTPS